MNDKTEIEIKNIEQKIYTVRGVQIMLDRDLAEFYQTETRTLKQAVKRNIERFPGDFMFELNDNDMDLLVSQSVIPSKKYFGGAKPYAFTEQGVSMLSAVIRSPIAVAVSLKIIRAFVEMRKFISANAALFQRIENLEIKQLATENKLDNILKAIDSKQLLPQQGIFFNGQIFDAWVFISDLVKSAQISLILIDNYVDETVLSLFAKKKKGVSVSIYTQNISRDLQEDAKKFNAQYGGLSLHAFNASHDRFLLIDNTDVYHIGASLKDLGKKLVVSIAELWFAFSKMEKSSVVIFQKLGI
ncbi:MAG TPA: ORF6N domain-containing protein [Bacteroidia bacterium]|nr:ORF6N domain-containing protein [Bacteroidia bacterium]